MLGFLIVEFNKSKRRFYLPSVIRVDNAINQGIIARGGKLVHDWE